MIENDLNLKTKIKISDKELDFELWTIIQGAILAVKLDGKPYSLDKETIEPIPKFVEPVEKPITIKEKPTIEELSKRKMTRAPNNTLLLLNWLKSEKIEEFDISEFTKEYPYVTMEQAELIIAQQLVKNKLRQRSNTRFEVLKREGDDG
jgi:hypothetical protein